MKALSVALTLLMSLALVFGSSSQAEEKGKKGKEVTLTGNIVCGKCTLSETDACSNVLQVKKGDKTVNYYFLDKGRKEKYHSCAPGSGKDATVTGTVTEKGGKKYITASKVDLK